MIRCIIILRRWMNKYTSPAHPSIRFRLSQEREKNERPVIRCVVNDERRTYQQWKHFKKFNDLKDTHSHSHTQLVVVFGVCIMFYDVTTPRSQSIYIHAQSRTHNKIGRRWHMPSTSSGIECENVWLIILDLNGCSRMREKEGERDTRIRNEDDGQWRWRWSKNWNHLCVL